MELHKMGYDPHLELLDGANTDMRIEDMLNLIWADVYDRPHFNETYTAIVREYINSECPDLMASHAGLDRVNVGAMHYLAMLRLDFTLICEGGPNWPHGGFAFMPDATVAISVHHSDGETVFDYAPGRNLNQASLAAIMQVARQVAYDQHNQYELPIDGDRIH